MFWNAVVDHLDVGYHYADLHGNGKTRLHGIHAGTSVQPSLAQPLAWLVLLV